MCNLSASVKTGKVYMEDKGTLYTFSGTPLKRPNGFVGRQVGEVPCLFDWQKDPAAYGPDWVVATVSTDSGSFVVGGHLCQVRKWVHENEYAWGFRVTGLYEEQARVFSQVEVQL